MTKRKMPPLAVYSPDYHARLRDKVREHTANHDLTKSVGKVRLKGNCRSVPKN